ncbi:MAG: hypothetical protein H7839_13240 [Magnetococcus sp. YQC-5]
MKRTGNLFNTIISFGNLWLAAHKAWRGKKDKTRIADFYFNLEHELIILEFRGHHTILGEFRGHHTSALSH